MKKSLLLFIVLGILLTFGAVSAQDDPLANIDPSGQTVIYWHEWAGTQETAMDEIIRLFNETNEYGITVEQQKFGAGPGLSENISAAITSGELPNLSGDGFVGRAQGWYLDGVLVPLDAYVTSTTWGFTAEEAALIDESILAVNRPAIAPFDGQLLAWPVGVSANVLSVNLDMLAGLKEAGAIDFDGAPTTFDQFRAAACAAAELTTADGGDVGGFAIRGSTDEIYSFVYSNGGYIFDAEANAYNFTNEAAISAMQFLQGLYNDGCAYYPEGGGFANTGQFSLGLNAFAMGSSVGVPFIQGDMNNAGLDINWINTTAPWSDENRTVVTFLRGVAMFQGTPEQNLATWLFIKFWATNQEAQQLWTEGAQYQPYNSETAANISPDFLANNPQFASFAEALTTTRLWSPPAHPRSSEIGEVVAELFANITVGGMDVAEAAAAAEARANEIYTEVLADLE